MSRVIALALPPHPLCCQADLSSTHKRSTNFKWGIILSKRIAELWPQIGALLMLNKCIKSHKICFGFFFVWIILKIGLYQIILSTSNKSYFYYYYYLKLQPRLLISRSHPRVIIVRQRSPISGYSRSTCITICLRISHKWCRTCLFIWAGF